VTSPQQVSGPLAWVAALRPRQWLKNLLVVAAPLAAGTLTDPPVLRATIVAFVVFCAAASAVYLVNDVVDREHDRHHPVKCRRPIAAGSVPVGGALVLAAVLALGAVLGAGFLATWSLAGIVVLYLALSLLYSLRLKHEPVMELALLTSGFLLRAVAGGVASSLTISPWFLIVAGAGSMFMAAGKRYSELMAQGEGAGETRASLLRYTPTYLRFVWTMAAGVTVTAYCLWAFQIAAARPGAEWTAWSVAPFVLAVLRYAVDVDAATAEAPEDVVLHDRWLLALGLVWALLFGLGAAL
jgi:decaprenyl-phosphate phosphoribosyltransferase